MATCSHYSGAIAELQDAIELNRLKIPDYESSISQLNSAIQLLDSFAASLRYIGEYLKTVIINDEAFDKGQCAVNAASIDGIVTDFDSLVTECNDKITEINNTISEQEAALSSLIAEPCATCAELAAAAAAAAMTEDTTESKSTPPSSPPVTVHRGTR